MSSHVGSVIGAGTSNDSLLIGPDNVQPKQFFPSVSVNLTSRVGLKIKVKIWANEYVEFRASLASTPQVDKYALSMTPSTAPNLVPRVSHLPEERPWFGLVTCLLNKKIPEGRVVCLLEFCLIFFVILKSRLLLKFFRSPCFTAAFKSQYLGVGIVTLI